MNLLEKIIAVAAPFECLGCGQEDYLLCPACRESAILPLPPRCYRCGRATANSRVCTSCRSSSKLRFVWIAVEYSGLPKQLLHHFKFLRAQSCAPDLAGVMQAVLPQLAPGTIICPVPTASRRIRLRGYDHAELLAKAVAKITGYHQAKLLERLGQSRQVGSGRQDRLRQLNGAFLTPHREKITGATILLVDDIVTTGATIEAAGLALRQAGAKHVDALAFAKKS